MVQTEFAARLGNVRIPACSADWRFLLPIGEQSLLLVVTPDCDEFGLSLDAINVRNVTWRFADFAAGLVQDSPFDVIAFPLGIPEQFAEGSGPRFEKLLQSALRMLAPAGAVLIGFANRWAPRGSRPPNRPAASTPRQIKSILANVGFSSVETYCAFPNLHTPEFIFSPVAADLQFVLRRRYQHKIPAPLLSVLSSPLAVRSLLRAVPFYYAVAYHKGISPVQ